METSRYADTDPFVDDLFEALSNARRRMVIRLLGELETLTPREASKYIAFAESDTTDIDRVSAEEKHAVYVTLQQYHIKKLTETGIVVFEDNTLSKGPHFDCALNVLVTVDSNLS